MNLNGFNSDVIYKNEPKYFSFQNTIAFAPLQIMQIKLRSSITPSSALTSMKSFYNLSKPFCRLIKEIILK